MIAGLLLEKRENYWIIAGLLLEERGLLDDSRAAIREDYWQAAK